MDLYSPVTVLQGIGPARAKQLAGLGIESIYDLIAYFPRTYEDRTRLVTISELELDTPACFEAMVVRAPQTSHIRKGLSLTKLVVADETAKLNLVYFNQPYAADQLQYGESYVFYGTLTGDYSRYQMQNPTFEAPDKPGIVTRRIMPVYSLTAGLSNKLLTKCVHQALVECLMDLPDLLPRSVQQKYDLCSVREAYAQIHQPVSFEALERAKKRLIFEEFFLFSAGLQLMRSRRAQVRVTPYTHLELGPLFTALPFRLTDAQQRAIQEIASDFAGGAPMNRLLQGDVGSGKTMVAAAAAYLAV